MSNNAPPSIRLPLEFVDALSHANSVEAVLTVGSQWLARMFAADRGSLGFFDGERLIARVARMDGKADPISNMTDVRADGPCARVLDTGHPDILTGDELRLSPDPLTRQLYDFGARVILTVPMLGGVKRVGYLSVARNSPVPFHEEHSERLAGIGRFVAAQARLMQQLRRTARLAETDPLTGLSNRTRLMRVLDGPGALNTPDSEGRILGLLHIDLDHFKEVNDTLGHAIGDAILRHAASAMLREASAKDVVARVGGDEFVVVSRTDTGGRHLTRLAHRLRDAISEPVRVGGLEARVGASIGTAMPISADCTADRLIGNADMALYEVKRQGRGGVRAFCDAMRAENERRLQLLSDLHDAVEQRQFEPFFQPQVSMATGRFSGFEMLARWPHPTLGLVDPGDFIELAAEAGLSDRIDDIVRAKGLAALRQLRDAGWEVPKMSFNASVRTLNDPDIVTQLLWEVLQHGLSPSDLVLEVREADLVVLGSGRASDNINALSDAGFEVELDGFCAGFAAMTNLGRLSINGVKLDRSVISSLPDPRTETILRAVIAMAIDLDLGVVAEGIETPAQYTLLQRMGCHIAQGFGVSRPLPLNGLIAFMRTYGAASFEVPANAAPDAKK